MKKTAINPWSWSLQYGFSQGQLVSGQSRILFCAGQASIDKEGRATNEGDIRAQTEAALDDLEAVLADADMTLENVVRLTIYTTDMDAMLQNFDALAARTGKISPAQSLVGVSRLAFPEMMVEIEATAVS